MNRMKGQLDKMDRKQDIGTFLDMWMFDRAFDVASLYRNATRMANEGDPFWWAALTCLEDSYNIFGAPDVKRVLWDGEIRKIDGMVLPPLVSRWSFDEKADNPCYIGTLYAPCRDTRLGYVVEDYVVPELEPEFEIILRSVMRYAGLMDLTMFDHEGDATSAKALIDLSLDAVRCLDDRYGFLHSKEGEVSE